MATATNDDTLEMLGVAAIGAGVGMMIGASEAFAPTAPQARDRGA